MEFMQLSHKAASCIASSSSGTLADSGSRMLSDVFRPMSEARGSGGGLNGWPGCCLLGIGGALLVLACSCMFMERSSLE